MPRLASLPCKQTAVGSILTISTEIWKCQKHFLYLHYEIRKTIFTLLFVKSQLSCGGGEYCRVLTTLRTLPGSPVIKKAGDFLFIYLRGQTGKVV